MNYSARFPPPGQLKSSDLPDSRRVLACARASGKMPSQEAGGGPLRLPGVLAAMRELLAELTAALEAGRGLVYCVLAETRGSTPQKAGAAMLVFADGGQR